MDIKIRRITPREAQALSDMAKLTFYDTFTGTCTEADIREAPAARDHEEAPPERRAQVADRAVRSDGHRLLGEFGPDGARRVQARCAVGKFELRVVG